MLKESIIFLSHDSRDTATLNKKELSEKLRLKLLHDVIFWLLPGESGIPFSKEAIFNLMNTSGSQTSQITSNYVGNKAKGQISKWLFQENKARQVFRKANISYPLIRTRTCFLKSPF